MYRGEVPDVVPYMLDLSHWFYHRNRMRWDLSSAYLEPEHELIDYHKTVDAGFYMPNLAYLYDVDYPDDTTASVTRNDEGPAITWRIDTPLGSIQRTRVWEERTYAWAVSDWGVRTEQDLRVLGHALGGRMFAPRWDKLGAWEEYVGEWGLVYMPLGYSGMGYLLNCWMGVEAVMYAVVDWPQTMHEVIDAINESNLRCIDMLASSPAEVVVMGDNFSSDVQPPRFFEEWSRPFYEEAVRRLHAAGKYVAVHIDGKLRGALKMIGDSGADCADAVTPKPMGDLNPVQCREEAGPGFILSGGVSPDLWLPSAPVERFEKAVLDWLELKRYSPRLIAGAGDQVPPGAEESRIALMREAVEKYGRY